MTVFNKLYCGDNLEIMKEKMTSESVDLIYMDPPFNSARNFYMAGGEEAFCDAWKLDEVGIAKMHRIPLIMRDYGIDAHQVQFWKAFLIALKKKNPSLMVYMIYMVERLLEMKRILKPTGSIYLHCDSTASHYIKLMMDTIFGYNNFRNEIIWKRSSGNNCIKSKFGAITDTIFFYTKSSKYSFENQYVWDEKFQKYLEKVYRHIDENGRRYRGNSITNSFCKRGFYHTYNGYTPPKNGWRVPPKTMEKFDAEGLLIFPKSANGIIRKKTYLEDAKGKLVPNLWDDVKVLGSMSKERLGYPTQKPIALIERIIKASCPAGGVVFDPFCGSGTTIIAAIKNNMQWIGCDISELAVKLVEKRLTGVHSSERSESKHEKRT